MKNSTACLITTLGLLGVLSTNSKQVYNETLGYQGIFYSAAAYCAYETLTNWTCGYPCT